MRETFSISWSLSTKRRDKAAATFRPIAVLPAPIRPTSTIDRFARRCLIVSSAAGTPVSVAVIFSASSVA